MVPHIKVLRTGDKDMPVSATQVALKLAPKVAACTENQPMLAIAIGILVMIWAATLPIATAAAECTETAVSLLCIPTRQLYAPTSPKPTQNEGA